jgi:predicted CXXCH cytochrome family protein
VPPRPCVSLLVLALACGRADAPPPAPAAEAAPVATYAGAARCAGCHPDEAAAWRGSDHDRAMETAGARLGDFGGARFEDGGVVTRFFERDGRAFVRTPGEDGRPADFEVAYTFGFAPLQQLLLALPRGRLQALGVAWDARPRAQGGQRWYALYPGEALGPDDPLHWTQRSQGWNGRCADCHSTNLRRGYDAAGDRYATTWSELDVACEACHGPGSLHVAWAEAEPRRGGAALPAPLGAEPARWVLAEGAAIAVREPPLRTHAELEVCAPCHARRAQLREGRVPGEPFLDAYRPALLAPDLYAADGQPREEVYEYGAFLQSRMFAAGVRCSDCHEPHALSLRADGNALCGSCHRAAVFDTPAHHHHTAGSAGAACAACHMPARTWMGVDVRHEHAFRVPRPDLSVALGTPNACTDCHTDQSARWADAALARWFPDGRRGTPHFAAAFDAAARAQPGGEAALLAVAGARNEPALVRASALARLSAPGLPAARAALREALRDPDPLVRLGALEAAAGLEPALRLTLASPLLADERLAVRVEAARQLAEVPAELWRPRERGQLAAALGEYRAAQELNGDQPEAHVNLAALALRAGDPAAARASLETALRLAPWFVPALVNLADLERLAGREDAAEAALRRALAAAPEVAEPHYALGLLLVRSGRRDEALAPLARAAALAPEQSGFTRALALAYAERGDAARARATLEAALARRPADRTLLATAALLARDAGDAARALAHARALAAAWPDDPEAQALLSSLETATP